MGILSELSDDFKSSRVKKVKLFEPEDHVAYQDLDGDSSKVGGSAIERDMKRALRWGDKSLDADSVTGI